MSATNQEEYSETQAKFALQLLKQTQLEELKSSILSPISISIGLAIVYNGAAGETAKQIENVIGGSAVNHLYVQKEYKILQDFVETIKNFYNGELSFLDFKNNVEEARKEINNYVGTATNGLIKDIISDDILKADTRLVIINAMYFLGEWKKFFKLQIGSPKPEKFYVSKDVICEVFYMKSYETAEYQYESTKDYLVLGIDYKDSNFTMYIILPKIRYGLSNVIEKLDTSTLIKHAKNEKIGIFQVKLPRYIFNLKMDLIKLLNNIGIKDAFDPNAADFSNLTQAEKLYVYVALHQAFIKVNEKGTEMAAASTFALVPVSGRAKAPKPEIIFIADHPFLYFVADNKNGNILFIGTVVDKFQSDAQLAPIHTKTFTYPPAKSKTRTAKKRKIN